MQSDMAFQGFLRQQKILVTDPIELIELIELIEPIELYYSSISTNEKSLIIIIVCILIIILGFIIDYIEHIKNCYNYCRFHYNDKRAKLIGLIRRKLLEKQIVNKAIKIRMSPYVSSLPTDNYLPIKEFNLHKIKPVQTIQQYEHIIIIPTDYINPR